jgi:hypothetical protein
MKLTALEEGLEDKEVLVAGGGSWVLVLVAQCRENDEIQITGISAES